MNRPLTEKQRRFVEAYMGEAAGNATEAASLAGYKGARKTLETVGSENMRKPAVMAAIRKRVKADPRIATRVERQEFWTRVMLGEEKGTDSRDQLKASELLGKSQADFVERKRFEVVHSTEELLDRLPEAIQVLKGEVIDD